MNVLKTEKLHPSLVKGQGRTLHVINNDNQPFNFSEVHTVGIKVASVAWRSSQSGRARNRAREQSDGGRQKERKNASRQTPLKREKSFELAASRGR